MNEDNHKLYRDRAKYYDLLYSEKDYQSEVKKLKELIRQYKDSSGHALLDVACGTGRHLKYFQKDFICTGLDLYEGMIEIANERAPEARLVQDNMIDFELDQKFDVITCLFSSIGYVRTTSNLRKTLTNFTQHLKKGGVVIIEPWFTREQFESGSVHMTTYAGDQVKIARVSFSKRKGALSLVDMHYLVGEADEGVEYFSESHTMGIFETETILEALKETGLEAEYFEEKFLDRGVYLGKK